MSGEVNAPSHAQQPPVGLGLPPWITRGSVLMVMFAVVAPAAIPLMLVGLPVLAVITVWRLKRQEEARAEAAGAEAEPPKLVKIDEKEGKTTRHSSTAGQSTEGKVTEEKSLSVKKEDSAKEVATVPSASTSDSAPKPAVGGAAILAKLRAAKKYQRPEDHPVVVAYASQTGTAAEVAKNISSSMENEGVTSRVLPMNELGVVSNLTKEKTPFVIWVASSTGDGEAPDNATKFYNDLRNKKKNDPGVLRGIQFTGIGLGDSNYTRFMHVPRVVKNRFLELGATEFYPCVEADEVDGIEETIDSWIEKLLPIVKAAVKPMEKQGSRLRGPLDVKPVKPKDMALPTCSVEILWIDERDASKYGVGSHEQSSDMETAASAAAPFMAPISSAKYLTTKDSDTDRRVVHLQFDLAGSGIEYGPGDSLGVMPENDPALVDALLERIGVDGSNWFAVAHNGERESNGKTTPATSPTRPLQHIKWPCTVRDALLHGVDLTGPPKKSLLRVLAEYCTEDSEKAKLMHLCSREGRQEYMQSIIKDSRAFVDVLFENPSCKPPFAALLDALPPLAPRMYSISSSPLAIGMDKAEVAFTAVQYQTVSGALRKGVATWWLENKAMHDGHAVKDKKVPLYLRKGGSFSPPASLEVPWIMVGPGTGVSPFRGFLQQRRAMINSASSDNSASRVADCWLFFGCRDKSQDYLYGNELESFTADGTITKLCVAESRKDPDNKVYVQHLMLQQKDRLRELIVDQDAFVFICGDGHGMAKDVHNALIEIISSGDEMDAKEADSMLATMTREARYVKDVWS